MNENEAFETELNTPEKADAQSKLLCGLKKIGSSYLTTVIICACIAACGIAIAVMLYIWLGVAIAFISALTYMLLTKHSLRKNLGMSYESISGAISITKVYADGQTEVFIPSRLFWTNVASIADKAFVGDSAGCLETVHLPATLKEIGENVFEGCDALKTVYFEGSSEDWEKIESATSFDGLELVFSDNSLYEIKKPPKEKKKKEKKCKCEAKTTEAPADVQEDS